MAFWSKKSGAGGVDAQDAEAFPAPAQPVAAEAGYAPQAFAPPPVEAVGGAVGAAAPVEAAALPPEELNRRRAIAKHFAASFGEIISLLMRQPSTRQATLADLEWLVLPAVMAGQFALAEAQSKTQGGTAPIAMVLWARVSDEVDRRLAAGLDQPVRLTPQEWTSGPHLWMIEAVGDRRALPALLQRQAESVWKGQTVKFRRRESDGRTVVATLPAAPAAAG